jgi:DNA polymerase III epsilon subunit-like protein
LSIAYPSDYVVVDLETSGLDVKKNEIIEVGMLRVHQNEVVQTFNVLIKPEQFYTMKMYVDIFKPHMGRKRLVDVATDFNIEVNKYHRGLADCYTVKAIYDLLK